MDPKRTKTDLKFVIEAELEPGKDVAPAQPWESFPTPSGWSLAWDDRGLNYEANRREPAGKSKDR
jgi:hypothetical protein